MRDSRKFLKFTSNIVKLPKLCFRPSPHPQPQQIQISLRPSPFPPGQFFWIRNVMELIISYMPENPNYTRDHFFKNSPTSTKAK